MRVGAGFIAIAIALAVSGPIRAAGPDGGASRAADGVVSTKDVASDGAEAEGTQPEVGPEAPKAEPAKADAPTETDVAPTAGPTPESPPAPIAPEVPAGPAPVRADDRAALAWLLGQLPSHGIRPARIPKADASDAAWVKAAKHLLRRFRRYSERSRAAQRVLLDVRPLAPMIADRIPTHQAYAALRTKLRDVLHAQAHPEVPMKLPGYRVSAGTTDGAVAEIRERLLRRGYGADDVTGRLQKYWDPTLRRAWQRWQRAHGLPMTRFIDSYSLAALNKPLAPQDDTLRLALKRWRSLDLRHDIGRDIRVHINRFELDATVDGVSALSMRVVVGLPTVENMTPMRSAMMTRVVANPSWRLPSRIVDELRTRVEDIPEILEAEGFRVRVDRNDRWRITQPPGPENPLGDIKFPLLHTGGIYLHDTRARYLFKVKDRARSHGCVRVQDAPALARWVLESPNKIKALEAALNPQPPPEMEPQPQPDAEPTLGPDETPPEPSGPKSRIWTLKRRVATHLIYQTASVSPKGRLVHHPDIYSWDIDALADLKDWDAAAPTPDAPRPPWPFPEPAVSIAAPTAAAPTTAAPTAAAPSRTRYSLNLGAPTRVDDGPFKLEGLAGRITIFTFTASWCEACHKAAPELAQRVAALRMGGADIALIGILGDEPDSAATAQWLATNAPPFPLIRVAPSVMAGSSALGPVEGLPTTWIVGRTGVPLYRYAGAETLGEMDDDLRRYLAVERRTR